MLLFFFVVVVVVVFAVVAVALVVVVVVVVHRDAGVVGGGRSLWCLFAIGCRFSASAAAFCLLPLVAVGCRIVQWVAVCRSRTDVGCGWLLALAIGLRCLLLVVAVVSSLLLFAVGCEWLLSGLLPLVSCCVGGALPKTMILSRNGFVKEGGDASRVP